MSENFNNHNETSSDSEKMDISETSDHASAESYQSGTDRVDKQKALQEEVDNAPADVTCSAGRTRVDSALSLDLELPTLDSYQEEYVDFPSSPKHLKECFEANGIVLPPEGDSGTAGRSEDEDDEDKSIYQAVLSPDCRDVRLKKERMGHIVDRTQDIIEAILAEDGEDAEDGDSGLEKEPGAEKVSRRLLMPDLHDLSLADLYDRSASDHKLALIEDSELLPQEPGNMKVGSMSEHADVICSHKMSDGNDGFVMESHNSKLARLDYGRHAIKGLFVESPCKSLPMKRVSVSHEDLLDSPKDEESADVESPSPSRLLVKQPTFAEGNAVEVECGKVADTCSIPVPSPRTKPVPKTRTVLTEGWKSPSTERGPVLILDPSKLDLRHARRMPQVSEDASVEKLKERPGTLAPPQRGGRRKIRVSEEIFQGQRDGDSVSSGESQLSDTDMVSPDDADLDELLSPDVDTPDEMEDSIMERLSESLPPTEPIPELSAAEEKAEARNWRSCIVAGLERRIDMKVIEPYKRVLSHGGYLTEGSHNAIIVFSACYLPDRSRVDYDYVMDNLFLYVLTTLDQLVTEDYVLVYLHGATPRGSMPTFSWLRRCYHMIDRRLRKNLKKLYLVHPTFWLKTIVVMTRPFISSKFSRKLAFVETLAELGTVVPLELASIPDRVKELDNGLKGSRKKPDLMSSERDKFGDTIR